MLDKLIPAGGHYLVVPSDDILQPRPRALRANTAGTVTVVDHKGVSLTYTVAAGERLDVSARKVTASTATIHAWY